MSRLPLKSKKMVLALAGLATVLAFQNCGRTFQSKSLSSTSSTSNGSTNTNPTMVGSAKFTCSDTSARGISDPTLRRLTRFEFENTLKDIFGADVVATVTTELSGFGRDSFKTDVSEFSKMFSSLATESIFEATFKIAESVAANVTYLRRIAPACMFTTANAIQLSNDPCMQTFINGLGLKVYRRPLSSTESASYLTRLKTSTPVATSAQERVAVVIGQMLMQPELSFHYADSGTPTGNRIALSPYAVASRLSYRAIGSLPDDELFEAARLNQLSNVTQLRAHATRLLSKTPTATHLEHPGRRFVRHFFANWLQASSARNPDEFYSTYFGVNAADLKEALTLEAMRFGEHITYDLKGDFQALMTSNLAFPPTADAAKVLGTAMSNGSSDPKTVSDQRRGLFQRPILMLADEPRTPIQHRGAQFLKQALCLSLGAPPANADNLAAESKGALDMDKLTSRQIATAVSSASSTCMNCHRVIDPPGFAFDAFGPLGEFRSSEKVFNTSRVLVNTLPVDSNAAVLIDGRNAPVSNPIEMAEALGSSATIRACMAQQMFRYTRFVLESTPDACHLAEVEASLRSGAKILDAFSINAATEDLLWQNAN